MEAATDRLRDRGLIDDAGELSERGVALRDEIERETDRLDAAPTRISEPRAWPV